MVMPNCRLSLHILPLSRREAFNSGKQRGYNAAPSIVFENSSFKKPEERSILEQTF
jgi:hypothetical protein